MYAARLETFPNSHQNNKPSKGRQTFEPILQFLLILIEDEIASTQVMLKRVRLIQAETLGAFANTISLYLGHQQLKLDMAGKK